MQQGCWPKTTVTAICFVQTSLSTSNTRPPLCNAQNWTMEILPMRCKEKSERKRCWHIWVSAGKTMTGWKCAVCMHKHISPPACSTSCCTIVNPATFHLLYLFVNFFIATARRKHYVVLMKQQKFRNNYKLRNQRARQWRVWCGLMAGAGRLDAD